AHSGVQEPSEPVAATRARPIRVLHFQPSLDPALGGTPQLAATICRVLREAGVDVALYTLGRSREPMTALPGAETFPIEVLPPFPRTRMMPGAGFYHRLIRHLANFDLAHLHFFWNPASALMAIASRRPGAPYA